MKPMTWRELVKWVTPPILLAGYRRLFHRPLWSGTYSSIDDVPAAGSGFRSPRYAQDAIDDVRRALAAPGIADPVPVEVLDEDALFPLLAAVVARERGGRLRVLDYGGGAGMTYVHLLASLARDRDLEYHVVELDWAVQAGPALFAGDGRIRFHASAPESVGPLDIVLLKGVLNFVEDYRGLLQRLCGYRARYLYIVHLYAGAFPTFASGQQNFEPDIVPMWFISLEEIVTLLDAQGYDLILKGALSPRFDQGNFPETHRLPNGRACTLLFSLR